MMRRSWVIIACVIVACLVVVEIVVFFKLGNPEKKRPVYIAAQKLSVGRQTISQSYGGGKITALFSVPHVGGNISTERSTDINAKLTALAQDTIYSLSTQILSVSMPATGSGSIQSILIQGNYIPGRADTKILSVFFTFEITGVDSQKIPPIFGIAFTYDMEKGTVLEFQDLFLPTKNNLSELSQIYAKKIKSIYPKIGYIAIGQATTPLSGNFSNFILTNTSVLVYFRPNALYKSPKHIFTAIEIPYSQLATVLKPEYTYPAIK